MFWQVHKLWFLSLDGVLHCEHFAGFTSASEASLMPSFSG